MEKLFVTKLEIKKVRHLKDITINLSDFPTPDFYRQKRKW